MAGTNVQELSIISDNRDFDEDADFEALPGPADPEFWVAFYMIAAALILARVKLGSFRQFITRD